MAFDGDRVVPTKRKIMDAKDWNSECILPQSQLSSNKWSATSCKRMAILESLSENNNYIDNSIFGEQSSSLPIHQTSQRIINIFDSFKKKKNSSTPSCRPSRSAQKVPTSCPKSVPKRQSIDEDEACLRNQQQRSGRTTCTQVVPKKVANSTNIVKSRIDSIFKPCKNKLNSKVQINQKTMKEREDFEIIEYDSDDDFEKKRTKQNIQGNKLIELFVIDSDEDDLPDTFLKNGSLCNTNLNPKTNNCARDHFNLVSPPDIKVEKYLSQDESLGNVNLKSKTNNYSRDHFNPTSPPEIIVIEPEKYLSKDIILTSEIEVIDISDDDNSPLINNEISKVFSSDILNNVSVDQEQDEDTTEFLTKNNVDTLFIKTEDHQIISNIDFSNYKLQLDSFENWRRQFKYLKNEEFPVSKEHYEKCDSALQFDSFDEIIRLDLFCDNPDYRTDGVSVIDSYLTPKMKMKDDLFLKLINIMLTTSAKELENSSYTTLMKMVSLFSWNFDDNLWPHFETVANRLCDKDSGESIKETSFRLLKILLFIVSEIGINPLKLNNNVIDHGTSVIKVNFVINWISLLSSQFQFFEKYGKPFFYLLKYTVLALEKIYMIETAAEKMYLIIKTLPNVHQRQYVIGLTEPKYLKLQMLSLILEKNEDLELNCSRKSFSQRLIHYFVNSNCLKNFKYSDVTVEILQKESYEELVFILNSVVLTFLETIVDKSFEDCSLEMQFLPLILEAFHNFSDRVINSCASIKNYYVFHELDYLINFTLKNYSKNV